MSYLKRSAKINVKVLVVLILVTVAVGVSLVVARQVRRNADRESALQAGQEAYEKGDWPEAVKNFKVYLDLNADDIEILKKYADACLPIRPLEVRYITGAVSAYRRILELNPLDEDVYEELAKLYVYIGHSEELASLARTRLEHAPSDLKAPLWLADALIRLNRAEEAEQTLERFMEELEALPDKHTEYAQACILMSGLVGSEDSGGSETIADPEDSTQEETPLQWLDRAVEYAPDSAEALACRARYHRQQAGTPDTSEEDRHGHLVVAIKDLQAADAQGTEAPGIRYLLATEWMAHGEFDRATAELQAVESLPREKLQEHFFDVRDWTVARYLLASELAKKRGSPKEAAFVADEALAVLKENRYRFSVLPSAVPLYVAAGKVTEARRYLDEYVEILHGLQGEAEFRPKLAYLEALVAQAEERPYAVIDTLQPVLASDPSRSELWGLLAVAYSRVGQTGRAVGALTTYLGYRPQDHKAALQLAKEYFKLGDWSKALAAARIAESLRSTDVVAKLLGVQASMNLAIAERKHIDTTKLEELSADLTGLRQKYPDQVDVRVMQATIATHLGQPDRAEKELKLAVQECNEPLRAEMQLVTHYQRTGRMAEAVTVCEAACERHAEVAKPWLSLSDLHMADAEYDSARSCLSKGLDSVIGKSEERALSIRLALLEIMQGDRAQGVQILHGLAQHDERDIRVRELLLATREVREDPATADRLIGEIRETEGETGLRWRLHQATLWLSSDTWRSKQQEAANLLAYCIDADRQWLAPVLLLAGMYERLPDLGQAEEVYRQGLAENPAATELADRLLALLERQERYSDADRVLRQMQIDPRVASDWRVRVALGAGEFMRAIDELKLKVSNDDQDAPSRIQLARLVYQQTKDTEEAFRYLEEARAIAPDSRTLVATRAVILRGEGRVEEALQVLDDYVADQNDFNAYWMRAVYFAEGGELQRAEEDYKTLTTFTDNGAAAYELLGNFYAGTDRLDQAVATAEEGVSTYPDSLSLKRTLMRLLFRRAQAQDEDRALEILAELEEQVGEDTDPELMTSRVLQMVKDPNVGSAEVAREKLKKVIGMQPRNVTAHLLLIGIEMRAGQYKAACDAAIEALRFNPNNPALLLARARAELVLGYGPMAFRLADRVLRQDPNNAEALVVLTNGALSSRDTSLQNQARSRIDLAVRRDPTNERLLISRAHVLTELKETKMAIPELEAYCRTEAGNTSVLALVTLADLYRLVDDFGRAEQWINRAEKVDAGNQTVVHARFMWYIAQPDLHEQLAGISPKYITADGQNSAMVMRAGEFLLSLDSTELKREGVELFKHAAAITNNSRAARLGLATGLQQTGDVVEAQKVYRELLKRYPDDVQVLNNLAWILQEHDQDYEEALRLANRGLRFAPRDPYLLDTKGTILEKMGLFADAVKVFERLREVCEDTLELLPTDNPGYAEMQRRLEGVLQKLADLSKAGEQSENASGVGREIDTLTPSGHSEIESFA